MLTFKQATPYKAPRKKNMTEFTDSGVYLSETVQSRLAMYSETAITHQEIQKLIN